MDYLKALMVANLSKVENATSHVDVMGLLLVVMVHSASIQERRGFKLLSFKIRHLFPNLKVIWVDGGYDGQPLQLWVKRWFDWIVETIKRNQDPLGFEVVPKRWVVERTFGWLGRYRRLSKDYEYLPTKARNYDLYRHDKSYVKTFNLQFFNPCVYLVINYQTRSLMLSRNLFYTGLTRAKQLALIVGSEKAIAIAVKQVKQQQRYTRLKERLTSYWLVMFFQQCY